MKILPVLIYAASALAICAFGISQSTAATEKVLYSFPANSSPYARPEQDSKGVLYGIAENLDGYGAIFRLKQKNGSWVEKTLFDFGGSSGANPWAGPLIDRSTAILYGTTLGGGTSGYGTVYSLAPAARSWSETVLHSFSGSDGSNPYGLLLKDRATGNLYGTTQSGGTYGCGSAFQLAPSNGTWTFSTIHTFSSGDACHPFTQLKPGAKRGTLIGAAPSSGDGQVFQLKQKGGVWSSSILYSFKGGTDGASPWDLDGSSNGTIYGVAVSRGQYGGVVVFQLTPTRKKYSYRVIYNFRGGSDGAEPVGINFDPATGNLYGTTFQGGTAGRGTLFKLTPSGDTWTEAVLHSFTGGANDGASPGSRPIVDHATGAVYGTTVAGGVIDGGTVYEVQP